MNVTWGVEKAREIRVMCPACAQPFRSPQPLPAGCAAVAYPVFGRDKVKATHGSGEPLN